MLRDGKYAAWFRTAHGQGTGIVYLAGGTISDSDCYFTYAGTYEVDNDRFTAVLTTRRHADGPPTVFGPDEVEINLSGMCTGAMATCSGKARQAPNMLFEATLIYSREETPATGPKDGFVKLKADKLPKVLDVRSRGRNPFKQGPSRRP